MTRTAFALVSAMLLPILGAAAAPPLDTLEAFARAVGMKPGAWRTRITITDVEFRPSPNASAEDLAELRSDFQSRLGKVRQRDECLHSGAEDRLRLPGIVIDPSCSVSGMKAADGRWTLDSTCSDPAKSEFGTMRGEGTYSRKAVTGRHEGEAQWKGVVVYVKAEFDSLHIGKCNALQRVDVRD